MNSINQFNWKRFYISNYFSWTDWNSFSIKKRLDFYQFFSLFNKNKSKALDRETVHLNPQCKDTQIKGWKFLFKIKNAVLFLGTTYICYQIFSQNQFAKNLHSFSTFFMQDPSNFLSTISTSADSSLFSPNMKLASIVLFCLIFLFLEKNKKLNQVVENQHDSFDSIQTDNLLKYISGNGEDLEIIDKYLKAGADINGKNSKNETPLHFACNERVMEFLIKNKADVNWVSSEKNTPLHIAAAYGTKKMMELLVNSNAKINIKNLDGNTPLHFVAAYGNKEMLQFLIDRGAKFEIQNEMKETPLHLAAAFGTGEMIKLLIKKGADSSIEDEQKELPLHFAVKCENIDGVTILIKNKEVINAQNQQGETPLHLASKNGNNDIASLLINAGAHIDIKDNTNLTPRKLAKLMGHKKLAYYLKLLEISSRAA